MPRQKYDYAVIRVVPRVERGEFVNAGAVVFCRPAGYLAARIALEPERLRALDPAVDLETVFRALSVYPLVAGGDPAAGPVARLPQPDRFHWLVSPRSTIIQPSPVHAGLADDLDWALERLLDRMVRQRG
jgi:hypothetical protein